MKKFFQIARSSLLLTIPIGLLGCSKYYGCDPEADCLENRPEEGRVMIRVSEAQQGDSVRVELREGNWRDGSRVLLNRASGGELELNTPVDRRYTAEASYPNGGDTLRAYDSGLLQLEDLRNCDEVCYRIEDLELELERAVDP